MEELLESKRTAKDGSVSIVKESTVNGITKSIEVKKVEGGYIIRKTKHGKAKDDEESEWINEVSESVSLTNPFEKKEEKNNLFSFVDNTIID